MNKNIGIKILALVIALIIWLQINLLKEQTITMKIPLRIINIPENIYINKQESIKLNFQITGEGIAILTFYLSNPYVEYDASTLSIGKNPLSAEKILPFLRKHTRLKFTVLDDIEKTSLSAERIIQKKVNVQMKFETSEAKEYYYTQQFDVDERTVLLSGPIADIQKIESITTEPITLGMIKDNKKVRFELVNDHIIIIPSQLNLVKQNQAVISKTFTNIIIRSEDPLLTYFPDRVSVIIEGKKDSLNLIGSDDIQASVNEKSGEIEVSLKKESGLTVIDYTPQKVTIRKKD